MSVGMVGLVGKPIVVHDFSADKGFERQGRKHVEAEKEASDVDHDIVVWEVVEHVAKRLVAKGQVPRQCHDEACDKRYTSAVMCDSGKAINCRFSERAVDEKTVMVTNKGKCYDANGFEYTRTDHDRPAQLTFRFGWNAERLCDYSHDDDNHADQSKATGFRKLLDVS